MPRVQVVTPDGERIKALRLELGLTPEQLAAKIAPYRHGQTIRAIERGEKPTSLKLLGQLAKALNVGPADLIARSADVQRSDSQRAIAGGGQAGAA